MISLLALHGRTTFCVKHQAHSQALRKMKDLNAISLTPRTKTFGAAIGRTLVAWN